MVPVKLWLILFQPDQFYNIVLRLDIFWLLQDSQKPEFCLGKHFMIQARKI